MEALSDAFYEARKTELAARVGKRRFDHSVRVSQTAEQLAKLYGVDVKKARLAGILHDWDKCYDDPDIKKRVAELGLDIAPEIVEGFPQTLHEKTAAAALAREYPEIPADVIQAISRHTTGAVDMTPLDMVLYVADGLEPGRDFAEAQTFRAMIGQVSLEDLFVRVYGFWMQLILERRRTMHPQTIEVWNAYASHVKHTTRPDGQYVTEGVAGEEGC